MIHDRPGLGDEAPVRLPVLLFFRFGQRASSHQFFFVAEMLGRVVHQLPEQRPHVRQFVAFGDGSGERVDQLHQTAMLAVDRRDAYFKTFVPEEKIHDPF